MFLPGFDAPSATGGADYAASRMIDSYSRAVSYLRLSVTDRCDCRCIYCMPERMSFLPKRTIFSPRQLRPRNGKAAPSWSQAAIGITLGNYHPPRRLRL
jgi:hypothetical protein